MSRGLNGKPGHNAGGPPAVVVAAFDLDGVEVAVEQHGVGSLELAEGDEIDRDGTIGL
jgi:hypothetical protein